MSEFIQYKINILHLPEEVLRKILSYLPDQLIIGQVCKTFYKISCQLDSFGLNIIRWGETRDDEHGEDIYRSILNSERKIDSIQIKVSSTLQNSHDIDTIKRIIQRFGQRVKKFKIEGLQFNLDDFSMLNLMPNLDQLELRDIKCENNEINQDYEIQLFNLRKIFHNYSLNAVQHIFDRLPKNTLREFKLISDYSVQNLTKNQSKLKKLFLDDGETELLSLSGLKELTELTIGCMKMITQKDLNRICEELKSLQTLNIGETLGVHDLSGLRNLPNLKKLGLSKIHDYNYEVSVLTIESSTLEILHLTNAYTSMFEEFRIKCPNLRELLLDNFESSNFSKLLKLLPKLERFRCNAKPLKIAKRWKNRSLKHLELTYGIDLDDNSESDEPDEKIDFEMLQACKSLKTFSTPVKLSGYDTYKLLVENPKLTSLCFKCPTMGNSFAIQEHGDKLESLHVTEDEDMSKEAFENLRKLFPFVKKLRGSGNPFDPYNLTQTILMMRKRGKVEKCCENLEMDEDLEENH